LLEKGESLRVEVCVVPPCRKSGYGNAHRNEYECRSPSVPKLKRFSKQPTIRIGSMTIELPSRSFNGTSFPPRLGSGALRNSRGLPTRSRIGLSRERLRG